MFNGKHFYHEHVRKAIIAFGTLFNGIKIERTDTDGSTVQILDVPLAYGPKQKYLARLRELPDIDAGRNVAITLPRMAFEITDLVYEPGRKLQHTQPIRGRDATGTNRVSYVVTPYNIKITLSVLSKNQEDGLQIIEQILPHFSPDFSVTIHELPALGVPRDLQIILDDINLTEDYDGDFKDRTMITWDLSFTMKLNFYGYVADAALIQKAIANIYLDETTARRRITVEPDPTNADPSTDFGFTTTFEDIPTE